jgi:hypothetical protein
LGIFALGLLANKIERIDAIIGFFTGLIALLFLVEGPIQNLLPGQGLTIAWPLYTAIGSLVVLIVGHISYFLRRSSRKKGK